MSKIIKEDCRTISIYRLKEWELLEGYKSGNISWTDQWDNQNSVSYSMDLSDKSNMYFELNYTLTERSTGKKHKIDHRFPIVTTSCNYGNERYWFECSVYKNNKYCGRRVAKLYLGGGNIYFACRHCYELTYQGRLDGWTFGIYDAERYAEKIKKWYYKGRPTKKHLRYNKMSESAYKKLFEFESRLMSKSWKAK